MSPHAVDRFAGHMPELDPRSPLFAAAGCVWPTVPGYQLFIGSQDAWGTLSFLNTDGIQLKNDPGNTTHDEAWWIRDGGEGPFTWATLKKFHYPVIDGFIWQLKFWLNDIGEITVASVRGHIRCNQNFLLPEFLAQNVPTGGSGATCEIMQVVFDEKRPFGGWPP